MPAEYIDPRHSSTPPASVDELGALAPELAEVDDEDALARSRRSTPKERPGRRRPTRVARHEILTPHKPTTPRPEPRGESSGVQRQERSDERDRRETPLMAAIKAPEREVLLSDRPIAPRRPAAPPLPTALEREPVLVSRPSPSSAGQSLGATSPANLPPPLPPAPAATASASQRAHADSLPAVLVDPALGAHVRPKSDPPPRDSSPGSSAGSRPSASYEPLPADRASYEAFMRAHKHQPTPSGRQGIYADPETALISKTSLQREHQPVWPRALFGRAGLSIGLSLVVGVAAAALLWSRPWAHGEPLDDNAAASAGSAQGSGAVGAAPPTTVIVTEPSGAEVLLGGAVVGNTPTEVPRPAADELYLLRMAGFEPQLVRLSPRSRDAVHITLTPLGTRPAQPLPPPSAAGSQP